VLLESKKVLREHMRDIRKNVPQALHCVFSTDSFMQLIADFQVNLKQFLSDHSLAERMQKRLIVQEQAIEGLYTQIAREYCLTDKERLDNIFLYCANYFVFKSVSMLFELLQYKRWKMRITRSIERKYGLKKDDGIDILGTKFTFIALQNALVIENFDHFEKLLQEYVDHQRILEKTLLDLFTTVCKQRERIRGRPVDKEEKAILKGHQKKILSEKIEKITRWDQQANELLFSLNGTIAQRNNNNTTAFATRELESFVEWINRLQKDAKGTIKRLVSLKDSSDKEQYVVFLTKEYTHIQTLARDAYDRRVVKTL